MEYYFVQLNGYEGADLRQEIVEKHRDCFVTINADGSENTTIYRLASSLLACMDLSHGIVDGFNLIEETSESGYYKCIFELIFKAMGQEQHYNMMMGNGE